MFESKIEKLRKKMYQCIQKYGIASEQTNKVSMQLDEIINQYYRMRTFPPDSKMKEYFDISYEALKKYFSKYRTFATIEEWNHFAKENNYLSSISIEYITQLKWRELERLITTEIQIERIQS